MLTSGSAGTVSQLQVAAYHDNGVPGDTATFTIYSDVAGAPGLPLASFAATNLPGISAAAPPSTAPVINLSPAAPVSKPGCSPLNESYNAGGLPPVPAPI